MVSVDKFKFSQSKQLLSKTNQRNKKSGLISSSKYFPPIVTHLQYMNRVRQLAQRQATAALKSNLLRSTEIGATVAIRIKQLQ